MVRAARRVPGVVVLAMAVACQGDRGSPNSERTAGTARGQVASGGLPDDLLIRLTDGNGDVTVRGTPNAQVPRTPGVIVRFKGRAAFEAHAAELARRGNRSSAAAAAAAQRATLK